MDDGGGSTDPGLKAAASRLAAGAIGLARTRLELAAVEFAEERGRVKSIVALAAAGAVLATLAVATLSVLVVAYFWDTWRYQAIFALAAIYGVLAVVAFLRISAVVKRAPTPFAATIAEFEKDRALLTGEPPRAP